MSLLTHIMMSVYNNNIYIINLNFILFFNNNNKIYYGGAMHNIMQTRHNHNTIKMKVKKYYKLIVINY